MLEARYRIWSGGKLRPVLSVQHAVSCSTYSQGCDGGFPFLIAKVRGCVSRARARR